MFRLYMHILKNAYTYIDDKRENVKIEEEQFCYIQYKFFEVFI